MEKIDIRYLQYTCHPMNQTKQNQPLKNFQSRWKDSHYWSMRLFCKVDQAHSISTYAVNQQSVEKVMYREKWKGGWTGWINLVIMEKGYLVMHVCVNVIWTYYNTIMGMWFVPKINLHTCIIRSLVNLTFSFSAYYRYVDVHTYHTLWYTISRFFRSKN